MFSSRRQLQAGDILKIVFDTKNIIKYKIEMKRGGTDKVSLNQPGVATFSFLPAFNYNTSSDKNNRIDYTVEKEFGTVLAVQVTAVNQNGIVAFEGQHTMLLNGQQESIRLSGRINANDLYNGNSVKAVDVANLNLVYLGPTRQMQAAINNNDLVYRTNNTATNRQGSAQSGLPELTDARKRQLIRDYLNRIANILFMQR